MIGGGHVLIQIENGERLYLVLVTSNGYVEFVYIMLEVRRDDDVLGNAPETAEHSRHKYVVASLFKLYN